MFPPDGDAHARPEQLFAGRYVVDGPLRWGGLTTYYRAAAEGTPMIACVLPMDVSRSPRAEEAFSELTYKLGKVQAPSVPRVLDAGIIDGVPYLGFEGLRGVLLTDLLRERALSSLELLHIATDILDGLDAAHAEGLVHGDLTPQNVIVARNREGRLAARMLGVGLLPLLRSHPDASAHAANTGSGKHAISYMAPELFGRGVCEAPADLYAVGALLHHMATGSPPTIMDNSRGFDRIPELPQVIRRAMARQPAKRYPSAASMRAALEWLDIESAKRGPHTSSIAPPPRRSEPAASVSGARPIPIAPMVVDQSDIRSRSRARLGLLLLLLGTLLFSSYWYRAQVAPVGEPVPMDLQPERSDGR